MIPVRYTRGLELPQHGLWLDPWDGQPFAFVSHAHSDHIADHREIIATHGTARLMDARMPGVRRQHLLPFGERREFEGFAATLVPAGHIFGSAQMFMESDAGSLLYTGDFKLRPSLSAEPAEWRHAETLIMETTYGLPKYRMPPTEEVVGRMVAFCQEAIDDGAVPVLLGYSLGKSQEILCAILKAGLTPMLHGAVYRMTQLYRELRPDFPDGYVRYAQGQVEGKVLVCPPSAAKSLMVTRIKNRRTAVLTGWALDPGATYRYQCDAAFPLTDHADYPDLVRYVELVQPKLVLTLHGFASDFARDLRERGFEAWALSQENQLELKLAHSAKPARAAASPVDADAEEASVEPSELLAFARLGEQISGTASKLKKIALLADYLAQLAAQEPELAGIAATFLTGRPFAQSDNRTLQTGWAVIHRALSAASGKPEHEVREVARRHNDLGKTAYEVLLGTTAPEPFSLRDCHGFFEALHHARGPLVKTELLQERLARLDPLAASYLVRILTGDLRIGLREGLVEDAVAAAFHAPGDDVREANMLLGDMGRTALLASRGALAEASLTLFRPIKCMLASPEPTAMALFNRMVPEAKDQSDVSDASDREHTYWVEDKFDGIRAQLHFDGEQVRIYTRDLRDVTGQFADVVRHARSLPSPVILDGEILAYEEGKKLTFFDLQKRLGRKTEDDLFQSKSDVPVIFRAFDLLWLKGESLLRRPLVERRRLLEGLAFPKGFELTPITPVHSPGEIEAAFNAARLRHNEGLIAKDGASLYTPGRRGLAWLKLKKQLATLDVVVTGAELGHGKRSGVLSDYTFAVRDDETGALLNIGKAYSGVTDVEIEELTEHFINSTIATYGNYRQVRPEIVFEVAFDSVNPSTRHPSGLALRFPRIKAIRRDKTPAEIDTLSYAKSLVSVVEIQ
jgi:DNA ligase-1